MAVAKLWCALVGMKSPPFSVSMDLDEDVGDLEEAIKRRALDETARCSAKDLQLFVAKSTSSDGGSSSEWIKFDRATEDALEKGTPCDARQIQPAGPIQIGAPRARARARAKVQVITMYSECFGQENAQLPTVVCAVRGSWRLKKLGGQIECHRGIERPDGDVGDHDLTPLPLVLLNETFARFDGNCRQVAFGNKDGEFVMRLCQSLSAPFVSQEALAKKARDLLDAYLFDKSPGASIRTASSSSGIVSGGEYVHEETQQLLLRLECRLQKGDGDGDDPTMQNAANYIKHLPDRIDRQLPCFLVGICGPLLSIFGIVNLGGDGVICEPLAASFPLLFFDNERLMTGLIRTCASLKAAVHELTTRCSGELATRQLGAFDLDRSRFPYKDAVEINGTTAKLQYVSHLERYVFVAKDDSSRKEVIVKFAKRFGQRVHEFCARKGFAPDLLGYEVLPCRWSFVVMEKLDLVPLSQAAASRSDGSSGSSPVRQHLLEIKDALEAAGFVHGDLRGSNVLWDPEKKRVVLVDFDWAGEDSTIKCPPFMNSETDWPPGAETGKCAARCSRRLLC